MMKQEFPDWGQVTPERVRALLPQYYQQALETIDRIEADGPTTFETLEYALDDGLRPVSEQWQAVYHMLSVRNSAEWRAVHEEFQAQMVTLSLRLAQSEKINRLRKDILMRLKSCGAASTNATRIRILEKAIEGAELSGISLPAAEKKRYNEIVQALSRLSTDFSNAVLDATKAFTFEKDGKKYGIDDASYMETMKFNPDSEVREALYRARSTRAPENAARVKEILKLRFEEARLLGFNSPAEISIQTKCAPSIAAVEKMINDLDHATAEIAVQEEKALGENLKPWDRAYAAEKLRQKDYNFSEEELKKYFPLDAVIQGLFRMTTFLFGVTVRELTGAAKPSVWHPDVRVFELSEKGAPIANFYIDPYVRPGEKNGGAWMGELHDRSDRRNLLPLAYLVLNAPKPDEKGVCLMPYREVETIFHEFGHALQCMLTRVTEDGAAGISLVEWDAVEVASQFMENWCLDARTGIEVPAELKAKVLAARNFRAATQCRRQLAFAKMDLMLHKSEVADPNALKNEVFKEFDIPYLPNDGFLNAFTHIFAGGYAAGYYGYKWSEVMSADCYGAFEEAGLSNDAAVQAVGQRYRETILALGGSESAYDVFRRFRGRDPEITALLRQQGLQRAR